MHFIMILFDTPAQISAGFEGVGSGGGRGFSSF